MPTPPKDNVVPLHKDMDLIVGCEECGGEAWIIHLHPEKDWRVTGFQCDSCGVMVTPRGDEAPGSDDCN